MAFEWFFEALPVVALFGLGVVLLVFVFAIWRSISAPAPGISLGYYEVIGRYAGNKLLRRIKGTVVDATSVFINPELEQDFKAIISEDIDALLAKKNLSETEANTLRMAKKAFMDVPLSTACRINVARDGLFGKHVLIQWGRVDRSLSEFAVYSPTSKFSLSTGPQSQGVITGEMITVPQRWDIHLLGKVEVHLFRPDASEDVLDNSAAVVNNLDVFAKIALNVLGTVNAKEELRSKDEQLKEKDNELRKMGQALAAASTERDAQRRAIQGFQVTTQTPDSVLYKKLDVIDLILIGAPVIVGFYFADLVGVQAVLGGVLGLFLGAFFVYRRH